MKKGRNEDGVMRKFIFVFIALALFFVACIQKAHLDPSVYIRPATAVTIEGTFWNLEPCIAMYCRNSTGSIFAWFLDIMGVYEPKISLYKGNCWLEEINLFQAEGERKLNDTLLGKTDDYINTFMIGQGPNLAAADEAQRFCGSNLGFAVHYLNGPLNESSIKPIECTLQNSIIPFIIYNVSAFPGRVFAGDLARNLSGKGPILLAPGIELTAENVAAPPAVAKPGEIPLLPEVIYQSNYGSPIDEIEIIDSSCKNCLIVAFVKFNNLTVLHLLNVPRKRQAFTGEIVEFNAIDAIDVIGYGIDLNQFDCDKYNITLAISNFTQTISQTWKKPSIIVYLKAKEDSVCTQEKIATVYEYLFSNIPLLVPSGLIGYGGSDAAIYFNDSGIQNYAGRSFFYNCKSYYDQSDPEKAKQVPLLFPKGGESGFSPCTKLNVMSAFMLTKCDMNYSNISAIEPADNSQLCGDICFNEKEIKTGSEEHSITKKIDETSGDVLDGYEKYCELWSQPIRQFSNKFIFDQSVVRTIIAVDNGFDTTKEALKTGNECKQCDGYSGKNFEICCGIERLSYYYEEVEKTWNLSGIYKKYSSYSECGGEPEYARLFFAIVGYKYGKFSFESEISTHITCIKNENDCRKDKRCLYKFDEPLLTYRKDILKTISSVEKIRKICKFCIDERKTSGSPSWLKISSVTKPSLPFEKTVCVFPFKRNMGIYWLSGIILKDQEGNGSVKAIYDGSIVEAGEGPRRGKYVVTEGGGFTITYSGLFDVKKTGDVNAGEEIGTTKDFLRLEICEGSAPSCTDESLGAKREFIDPANFLDIKCTCQELGESCPWSGEPTQGRCMVYFQRYPPMKDSKCKISKDVCGGGFCSQACTGCYPQQKESFWHSGIDMNGITNIVYAASNGTVIEIGKGNEGKYVKIEDDSWTCRIIYGGLNDTSPKISVGKHVAAGDILGMINETLHFEILEKGQEERPIDPSLVSGICKSYETT